MCCTISCGCWNHLNTQAFEYTYGARHVCRGCDQHDPLKAFFGDDFLAFHRVLISVVGACLEDHRLFGHTHDA